VTISEFANEPSYIAGIRKQRVTDELIERKLVPLSEEKMTGSCQVQKITPPRPRPRKMSRPDTKLSASERMRFLMTGGNNVGPEPNIFEGTPDAAAERIINVLEEEELLE
jgi:hypothetical protein